MKRLLNAGCGFQHPGALHHAFADESWLEVRVDIDPAAKPDIVGSVTNMRGFIPDSSFDAVWSSHSLEHLHAHQVTIALGEFRRILRQDGFALITTPDLEAVARLVADGQLDEVAYASPAGPITALDMMFGHSASIAQGNCYMCHNTGFTCERLGRLVLEAGFAEVIVTTGTAYDLWALALMPASDRAGLVQHFRLHGIDYTS
jgi:predicted SAM-dependent methyltransferase